MASSNTTNRYRPGNYPEDSQLAVDMKTIYDQVYSLNEQALLGVGMDTPPALASGVTTVTGSQNGIATGLATVTNVIAVVDSDGAPCNEIVTPRPNPNQAGRIDLFVWKPTAAGDTTPIASTTARKIRWFAVGERVPSATSV